jgi:hypothetical protein
MKLYQKFLYSALLISVFVLYVNIRNLEVGIKTTENNILKTQITTLEIENKLFQAEISHLMKKIDLISVEEHKATEAMISNYIIKNFRRTPITVAQEISRIVMEISEEKKLASPLLLGIIEVESSFNPYAVSKAGARGLMQVMPEWIGKLKTTLTDMYDLHDIRSGISAGADVFNIHLAENNGNVNKGLYYYVNKDQTYVLKVYTAIGKFLAFSKAE